MEHAAGEWQRGQLSNVIVDEDDERNNNKNNSDDDANPPPPPSIQPYSNLSLATPQQLPLQTQTQTANISLEDGNWKGIVVTNFQQEQQPMMMDLPRAVSQDDYSSDIGSSQPPSSVGYNSNSSSSQLMSGSSPLGYTNTLSSPITTTSTSNSTAAAARALRSPPATSVKPERLGDVSALTVHQEDMMEMDQEAGGEEVEPPMGPYFPEHILEHNRSSCSIDDEGELNIDATAYYSAGSSARSTCSPVLLSTEDGLKSQVNDHHEQQQQGIMTPPRKFALSTSLYISLSPFPQVGDIYDTTSLTPGKYVQPKDGDNDNTVESRDHGQERVNNTSTLQAPVEHIDTSTPHHIFTVNVSSKVVQSSSSAHKDQFLSWRSSSILDDSEEESSQLEEQAAEDNAKNGEVEFSLASGLAVPSMTDKSERDEEPQNTSDPLYQLQQVSQSMTRDSVPTQQKSEGILSPLAHAIQQRQQQKQPALQAEVEHVNKSSLRQYLSSSNSNRSLPEQQDIDGMNTMKEPLQEDDTALSDIDVSRWTQESHGHDKYDLKETFQEEESKSSVISPVPSIDEYHEEGIAEEPPKGTTTPRKRTLNLNPKEFSSPSTTVRKNSLQISLEESKSYVARIDDLEAQLAAAHRSNQEQKEFYDSAIKEQKEYYESLAEEYHQFTLPLQPHSPFDPDSHQKCSPNTQQRKLLERNKTLLKEVRFADQTCVELSEQMSALEGKLQLRESQLEEMQRKHQDLTDRYLNSNRSNAQTEMLKQHLEQTKGDKLALERQLHASYDKLEDKTKQVQLLQEQHASDLEKLRKTIGSQSDGTAQNVSVLHEQINAIIEEKDQLKNTLSLRDEHLESIAAENDDLVRQVMALSQYKTNHQAMAQETDHFREKAEQQASLAERTSQALQSTQQDLADSQHDLESVRRESSNLEWKLKQTEQKLCEAVELNEQHAAEMSFAQEQITQWKGQAKGLQRKLDMTIEELNTARAEKLYSNDSASQTDAPPGTLHREFEFVKKLERDMTEMNATLVALANKFETQDGLDSIAEEVNQDQLEGMKISVQAPVLNPSLLKNLLASSNASDGAALSPQIVQVLQLIMSFTQQHLRAVDQKVSNLTCFYSEKILKLQQLVDHIRSSLVFESESDGESVSDGNESTRVLDATFAAVTSIPDQNVERMEEARTPPSNNSNNASPKKTDDSPNSHDETDTIMDLSKIEAINSPFRTSDISFCLDDAEVKGNASQKKRLHSVQRNVFRVPFVTGNEFAMLRKSFSLFQKEFVFHRETLSKLVQSQQLSLRQVGDNVPVSTSREAQLLKEREELSRDLSKAKQSIADCDETIRKLSMDLTAFRRSNNRLQNENEVNVQRIATLQQDMMNMENRLLSNGRGGSRTNSFQERLFEASISEQSSSTESQEQRHLRCELAEAIRQKESYQAEVVRYQRRLRETEESHGHLKISYVNSNDKLAAAIEQVEILKKLEKELQSTKQNESKMADQLAALEKQAKQLIADQDTILKEKEILTQNLKKAKTENELLESKYQKALNSFDGTAKEQVLLQAKYAAAQVEMDQVQMELKEALQTREESRQNFEEQKKELKQKLANATDLHERKSERINILEEEKRQSEEALNKLHDSYASCNNKLAEAIERSSTIDALVDEKKSLEDQLEASQQKIAELETEQTAFTDEQRAMNTKITEMRQAIDRHEKEHKAAMEAHNTLKSAYVTVNERLAEAQESIQALEETKKSQGESLSKQLAAKQRELDHMRNKVGGLLKEKEEALNDSNQEITALRCKLTEATKATQVCLEELDSLKASYAESNNKIAEIQDEKVENNTLTEKLKSLKDSETDLLEKLAVAKQEQDALSEELCSARTEVEESKKALESERDSMRESIESTRLQLEQITLQLGEDLKNTQFQLMQSIQDTQQLREELEQVTHEKDELEEKLEQLKLAYAASNDKLAVAQDKQQDSDEWKAACEAAEALAQSADERALEKQNDLEDLRLDMEAIEEERDAAQQELTKVMEDFDEYKSLVEQQEADLQDLLEATRNEKDTVARAFEDEKIAIAEELYSLRVELVKSQDLLNGDYQRKSAQSRTQEQQPVKQELQQLGIVVPLLCESISTAVQRLELSEVNSEHLTAEVTHLRMVANDLRSSLSDEKVVSSELCRQVKLSTKKIEKLHHTLDLTRGAESDARAVQSRDFEVRHAQLLEDVKAKEMALKEVESQKSIWEGRCLKLRNYMRKLTDKCAEWENVYTEQSKILQLLHSQRETKMKPEDPVGKVQTEVVAAEDQSFRSIRTELEAELNLIAEELQEVSWTGATTPIGLLR